MRREYASSPFCHWRHRDPRIVPANPIAAVVAVTTAAPPSTGADDPRRAAAERVLGPGTGGSACDWIRVYTESQTIASVAAGDSIESLWPVPLLSLTSLPPRNLPPRGGGGGGGAVGEELCLVQTTRQHKIKAGCMVQLTVRNLDSRHPLQAPLPVVAVESAQTLVVRGSPPRALSGRRLKATFGRSYVQRINGSFVTDMDMALVAEGLRTAFRTKLEAVAGMNKAQLRGELSLIFASIDSAHAEILTGCAAIFPPAAEAEAVEMAARRRRDAVMEALGAGGAASTPI
uniref:Uncharacterized protein n=1 Tax=Cryptomonas curvata TaxID=233186 RepID=A0A7S0QW28_9CRYP|mmetsp:Transcript_58546/g.122354  ORF Transcript_58546/g.122354 Transcript_58546/m.122354 type:complete len:288 (+) Transcript_58546:46-909(+)